MPVRFHASRTTSTNFYRFFPTFPRDEGVQCVVRSVEWMAAELKLKVVVDNGRSELLGRQGLREALSCIRCGACLNTCPVYRRSGGHSYQATVPGPIGSVLEAARSPDDHDDLPHACTLCGSCTDVCPVRIPLHHQLLTLRAELRARRPGPADHVAVWALAGWVMSHPRLYRLAGWVARGILRALPAAWGAALVGSARTLPRAPARSFRARMAKRGKPHVTP